MTLKALAQKLRPLIETAAQNFDDTTALEAVELFPAWKTGTVYTTGRRVRHGGILYTVLQDHTAQDSWTPDAAPSLFAKVLIPDPDIIPDWEQPESTNPYKFQSTRPLRGATLIKEQIKMNGTPFVRQVWKDT